MNPLTHFRKIRILPLLSLGSIFALVTAAHAQNLYVSANVPGGNHAIFEYTPTGTQSTYATGLDNPIGLAFDSSSGNLYVSIETFTDPGADSIVYFTPMGAKSIFATGLTTPRGLAFDSFGNLFVAEAITNGPILKFTGGVQSTFASSPGRPEFLTFGPPR